MSRVADPALVLELKRRFPDVQDLRWNTELNRWELVSLSAANRPVSQFWGWFHHPVTGATIEPDPVTGLVPFRDLVARHDQQALIDNLERGYRFKRGSDFQTWRQQVEGRSAWNLEQRRARVKQRAQDYAYMIQQCDLRRPWRKFHEHKPGQGRIIIT